MNKTLGLTSAGAAGHTSPGAAGHTSPGAAGHTSAGAAEVLSPATTSTTPLTLDLAKLKTVKTFFTFPPVHDIIGFLKQLLNWAEGLPIAGFFVLLWEAIFLWWWTFIHALPWPQSLLVTIQKLDEGMTPVLEGILQRLDWWNDKASVRVLRAKETLTISLDRVLIWMDNNLEFFFNCFSRLYDLVSWVLSKVTQYVTSWVSVVPFGGTPAIEGAKVLTQHEVRPDGDVDNSGEEDDDDANSDTSDVSVVSEYRKFIRDDAKGRTMNRHQMTAQVEGKLRAVMFHRVKGQLRIMRKNSIRFSKGLVNYANLVVGPRLSPYKNSIAEYLQDLAEGYDIPELMEGVQKEVADHSLLGMPLALAKALAAASLTLLLRKIKGKRSRRSRSVRSESLRRRTQLSVNQTTKVSPIVNVSPKSRRRRQANLLPSPLSAPNKLSTDPSNISNDISLPGSPLSPLEVLSPDYQRSRGSSLNHLSEDSTSPLLNRLETPQNPLQTILRKFSLHDEDVETRDSGRESEVFSDGGAESDTTTTAEELFPDYSADQKTSTRKISKSQNTRKVDFLNTSDYCENSVKKTMSKDMEFLQEKNNHMDSTQFQSINKSRRN